MKTTSSIFSISGVCILNTDVEPQDEIALEDDDEILLSGDNEDGDMADEAPEVFDIDDSEE